MKKTIFLFVMLLICKLSFCQHYTITMKGKITDLDNNEIYGATIAVLGSSYGTISDIQGNYQIKLPKGEYTFEVSFVGYQKQTISLNLTEDLNKNFSLEEDNIELEQIVIKSQASRAKMEKAISGVETVSSKVIDRLPTLMGEKDVIKAVIMLPGVKSESEGSSAFQVRGSSSGQNLILLDDAIVNNAGHLMGFFSIFNSDIVQNVTLYKGVTPAQYGSRAAAVLDIESKTGDFEKYSGTLSVGLLSSKIAINGPIFKNKTSFSIAARRTYYDVFLKLTEKFKNNRLWFYDLNANISQKMGKKDNLTIYAFSGKDLGSLTDMMAMDWFNKNIGLKEIHTFGKGIYLKSIANLNQYVFEEEAEIASLSEGYSTGLKQASWKENLSLSPKHNSINLGFQFDLHNVKTGEWFTNNNLEREIKKAKEFAIYANDVIKFNENFNINLGLRYTMFFCENNSKTYQNLDPKISLNWIIKDNQTIKLGYSSSCQNIHNIVEQGMLSQLSRFTTSSQYLKPEIIYQFDCGWMYLSDNDFEISLEGYYKDSKNISDYMEGRDNMYDINLESLILSGIGKSYGLEFQTKKTWDKLEFTFAYTLSKSKYKIDGINQNRWYLSPADKTHDINILANYTLKDWNFCASWCYATGCAITMPVAKYQVEEQTVYYYGDRNSSRAPSCHRLDIGVSKQLEKKGFFEKELSFGLYNAYNHYNPYMLIQESDQSKASGTKTTQYALCGIVPYVSFTIKF